MVPCSSNTGGSAERQFGSFTPASPTDGSDTDPVPDDTGGLVAGPDEGPDVGGEAVVNAGAVVDREVEDGVDVLASVVACGVWSLGPGPLDGDESDADVLERKTVVAGAVIGGTVLLGVGEPETVVVGNVLAPGSGLAVPPVLLQPTAATGTATAVTSAATNRRPRTAAGYRLGVAVTVMSWIQDINRDF